MYYVYMLQSNSNPTHSYIGMTVNLDRRLRQHNGELKGGAKSTRKHNDWIYYGYKEFNTLSEALKYEYYWKSYKGFDKRSTLL